MPSLAIGFPVLRKQPFWTLPHPLYDGAATAIFLSPGTKRQVGARLTQHGLQVYDARRGPAGLRPSRFAGHPPPTVEQAFVFQAEILKKIV